MNIDMLDTILVEQIPHALGHAPLVAPHPMNGHSLRKLGRIGLENEL